MLEPSQASRAALLHSLVRSQYRLTVKRCTITNIHTYAVMWDLLQILLISLFDLHADINIHHHHNNSIREFKSLSGIYISSLIYPTKGTKTTICTICTITATSFANVKSKHIKWGNPRNKNRNPNHVVSVFKGVSVDLRIKCLSKVCFTRLNMRKRISLSSHILDRNTIIVSIIHVSIDTGLMGWISSLHLELPWLVSSSKLY